MSARFSSALAQALALMGAACASGPSDEGDGMEQTAVLVETEDSEAAQPNLAMNAKGNAVLVWTHFDGTSYQFWANEYSPGAGWGTAQPIQGASGGSTSSGPKVAIDAAGNAIAVWDLNTAGVYDIYASRYEPTAGWSAAERIEADDSSDAFAPQVAFDASGDAMVVWAVLERRSV